VLHAHLPARRLAAVAAAAVAGSAAFGVADASAFDHNGTGTTNPGCRYVSRPVASISRQYRYAALMCALNRARKTNGAAPLRCEPRLYAAALRYATRSVVLKWWDRSNPLVSHIDPQTGSVAIQRDLAAKYCATGTNPVVGELTYSGGGNPVGNAFAPGAPTSAVNAWMNDPSQRTALLSPPGLETGPGDRRRVGLQPGRSESGGHVRRRARPVHTLSA
jgi:hypothetical protein